LRQFDATVTVNRDISPSWKALGFSWPGDLAPPQPGQFFTFRPAALEPGDSGLLRRPLAFAAFASGEAYALYQVRGPGTKALAATREGSSLNIIGALGNAFPAPAESERPILLGGGIGIGPLLFLHAAMLGGAPGMEAPFLALGFRSAAFVPDFGEALRAESPTGSSGSAGSSGKPGHLGLKILAESLAAAVIATDDGSRGYKGTVLQALDAAPASETRGASAAPPHWYACGPGPMLAAIAAASKSRGIAAHVSVEQWMACGVGACHGCVLKAAGGGYVRACADGPVFAPEALAWKE
jgi:dihydroorotate dehydrogenase electron transfer subunit